MQIISHGSLSTTKEEKRATGNYSAGNYIFKVNNRNIKKRCEICLKLTIKRPERRHGMGFHLSLESCLLKFFCDEFVTLVLFF